MVSHPYLEKLSNYLPKQYLGLGINLNTRKYCEIVIVEI